MKKRILVFVNDERVAIQLADLYTLCDSANRLMILAESFDVKQPIKPTEAVSSVIESLKKQSGFVNALPSKLADLLGKGDIYGQLIRENEKFNALAVNFEYVGGWKSLSIIEDGKHVPLKEAKDILIEFAKEYTEDPTAIKIIEASEKFSQDYDVIANLLKENGLFDNLPYMYNMTRALPIFNTNEVTGGRLVVDKVSIVNLLKNIRPRM